MLKKVLFVLANGFEESEAVTTIDIMRRAGIDVTISGLNNIQTTSTRGVVILCDKVLSEVKDDFDAIVFPGGLKGAENLSNSKEVLALIEKMNKEKKLVAAICATPAVVLSKTSVLDGKFATCYPGMQKYFKESTEYKEEAVVVAGNIITSQAVGTTLAFAFAVVEYLVDKEMADKLKKATVFNG